MNKTIEIYALKAFAWCVNDLMYLYSKNTSGVQFERDKHMHVTLTIEGKKYQCVKWSIHPDTDNEDYEKVTIYLQEVTQ